MKIIAHRGNDGIHKENTLKSIINSLKCDYVDGVEFDVRMTKDFKFVIHHDPFYFGYLISNTRLKKLQKRGIDKLDEVLAKVDNNKILLIEIKEERKKYHILAIKLYRLLEKYNLNYYIFSFNYDFINYFKMKYPNIKCGLLIGIKKNLNKINNNYDFNAINYHHASLSDEKETFIWTVNNNSEYKEVKKGQNIITDRPRYIYDLEAN